jgi:hypothetical protein
MNCTIRVTLAGDLCSSEGVLLCHFRIKPGQTSIFAQSDDAQFDAVARELLDARKRDRRIGA